MYTVRQLTSDDIPKLNPLYIRHCDKGHGLIILKDSDEIGCYTWDKVLQDFEDGTTLLAAINVEVALFEEHREKGHWETANAKQIIRAARDWQFNVGGYDKWVAYMPTNKLATDYDEGHWALIEDPDPEESFASPKNGFNYKICTCTVESYKKAYGIE